MKFRIDKSLIGYGVVAAAVWLGWEVVKTPIATRAPPRLAIRVAPTSPEVLRRAAEAELAAGNLENARVLSSESLARAPFNARTLRVLGLGLAQAGERERADSVLTLAGNLSLRDDPTHAWLIEQRLRQGDYASAFAHADTLARRGIDAQDRVFDLFATAALVDHSRALRPLAGLLARDPPWRADFLRYLIRRADGDTLLLGLGIVLSRTSTPLSDVELSAVYQNWLGERRLQAIILLRANTNRPARSNGVSNGDFFTPAEREILPFGWYLPPHPGISASVFDDDLRPDNRALRIEYDGYAGGIVAQQVLTALPGKRTLTGEYRSEIPHGRPRFRWSILCVESERLLHAWTVDPDAIEAQWRAFDEDFVVPETGCSMQTLRLETVPGDRRAFTVTWFDKLGLN